MGRRLSGDQKQGPDRFFGSRKKKKEQKRRWSSGVCFISHWEQMMHKTRPRRLQESSRETTAGVSAVFPVRGVGWV